MAIRTFIDQSSYTPAILRTLASPRRAQTQSKHLGWAQLITDFTVFFQDICEQATGEPQVLANAIQWVRPNLKDCYKPGALLAAAGIRLSTVQ